MNNNDPMLDAFTAFAGSSQQQQSTPGPRPVGPVIPAAQPAQSAQPAQPAASTDPMVAAFQTVAANRQQQQQPSIDLSNPQGQGTYQMKDLNGNTVGVPYGQVQKANSLGYQFANDQDRDRYTKDSGTTLTNNPVTHSIEGLGEGALQTITGTDRWAREHLPAVLTDNPLTGKPADLDNVDRIAGRTGTVSTGEKVGQAGEAVGEWTLGEGELKALTKTMASPKVLTFLAEHPMIAKSVEGALVGGTQAGLKGDDVKTGAALGAAGGAVAEGASNVAGKVAGAVASKFGDTPLGQAAARFSLGQMNPSEFAESLRETSGESPVEVKADKLAAKSGIAPGEDLTEAAGGPELAAQAKQSDLHQSLLDVAEQTTKDAGVPYKGWDQDRPQTLQAPRDIFGEASRNILDKSKQLFKQLDDASGGRWQRYTDQIQNISRKMDEVSGIDDDAFANLEVKRNEIATLQTQMLEDLKAEGKVDPAVADTANALYRKGMALQDLNNAVKSSIDRLPMKGKVVSAVNPEKLGFRLAKLNDIPEDGGLSRLEQAVGPARAAQLVQDTDYTADQLAKLKLTHFSSTGQKALSQIIEDNSASEPGLFNKGRVTTDWNGVMKDFNSMTPAEKYATFGDEFNRVGRFVRDQAWSQRARALGSYTAKRFGAGLVLGGAGYEAYKHLF